MHDISPLTLLELFEVDGLINGALRDLKAKWDRRMKHWRWIPEILSLVYEFNRSNPSGLVATPGIVSNMLWVRLGLESAPTSPDVGEARRFFRVPQSERFRSTRAAAKATYS